MFEKRNDKQESGHETVRTDTPTKVTGAAIGKSAIIGAGIHINGDISGSENLIVEGKIEGTIKLPGHQVEVGATGSVNADITAKYVKVEGELRGDINGKEKVLITKAGNVQGNIKAPRVQLEDGAVFKGSIDIDPSDTSPVELPLTPQSKQGNVQKLDTETASKEPGFKAKGG